MPLHTVADLGQLPMSLPSFHLPHVSFSWDMLAVIAPYSLALASVGLLESLMTAKVVADLPANTSSKARACTGLGMANFAAGLFGRISGFGWSGLKRGNERYGGRQ